MYTLTSYIVVARFSNRAKARAARHRIDMSRQLLAACMLDDTNRVREVLKAATKRGSIESANININAASELSGYCSPLLVATMHGNLALMKLLLSHGANIDFVATRRTATVSSGTDSLHSFHFAPHHRLSRKSSMPSAPTTTTASAVVAAAETTMHVASSQRLEVEHITALMIATLLQSTTTMKVLLKYQPDPRIKNASSQNVFHIAAIVGNSKLMKLLVDVYAANHSGLLASGANSKALERASATSTSNPSAVEEIGQRLPTVDINDTAGAQGFTPLFFAAACGHNEVIKVLCDGGKELHVNMDALTVSGITPLIAACYHNSSDSASTLLQAGADPNVIMKHNGGNALTGLGTDGTSSMQLALFHGDVSLAKLLFKYGALAPRDDQEIAAVCADFDLMVLFAEMFARQNLSSENISTEDRGDRSAVLFEGNSPSLESWVNALDFRALDLVKKLHGICSPERVIEIGRSQLLLGRHTAAQHTNHARHIFLHYNIDLRRGRLPLSVMREWLSDIKIDKYYGSEFRRMTRSLYRPRLIADKDSLRTDDSEDETHLPTNPTLNDYMLVDEVARRRKLHEEESALPFACFLKLYTTLHRLVR